MIRNLFTILARRAGRIVVMSTVIALITGSVPCAYAMSSARAGSLPQPFPLFPADNWWNLDITNWPVDANSASYIGVISNGGTRRGSIPISVGMRGPHKILMQSTVYRTL